MIGDCVRDARGERWVETRIGVPEFDEKRIDARAVHERIGDPFALLLLLLRWRALSRRCRNAAGVGVSGARRTGAGGRV